MENRISSVLNESKNEILNVWEENVKSCLPAARKESKFSLRDSIPDFLDDLIIAFERDLSEITPELLQFAHKHGSERANLTEYSIEDALTEYHILRKVIISTLERKIGLTTEQRDVIQDAIHLGMVKAGSEYSNLQLRNLESERKRLELITDTQPILISQVDVNLRYTFVNRAYESWYGIPMKSILGKTVEQNIGKRAFVQLKPYFDEALRGNKVVFDTTLHYSDSFKKHIHCAYVPGFDINGKVNCIYLSVADTTDQQENLNAYKKREKEYRELTEALNTEQRLRDKFISALSHDLRTPLTTASLSAQLISKKTKEEPVINLSRKIISSLKRVDKMIEDLLDASRIKAGKKIIPQIEEFNISDLINETIEDLETNYGSRFVLDAPDDQICWLSPNGVRRIIENLCSNAIKYGSSSEPVTISLKIDNASLEICVHNYGDPLKATDTNLLFKQFERINDNSEKRGWGIGLSVVKSIVDSHNGKIKVESDEKGTTFKVKLPIDARPYIDQSQPVIH